MGRGRRRGPLRRVIQKVRSNRGARGGGQRSREHGLGIFKRRPRSERQGLFGGEGLFGGGGIFPERGGTTVRAVEEREPVQVKLKPVPEEREPVPGYSKPKITIIPLNEDTEEKEIDPWTGLPEKPLQRVNVNKMWEGSPADPLRIPRLLYQAIPGRQVGEAIDTGVDFAVSALLDLMRGAGPSAPERLQPERVQPERTQPERIQPERTQPERLQPERVRPQKIERVKPLSEDEHWGSRYGHPDPSEVEGSLGIPDEVEEVTTITKVAPAKEPLSLGWKFGSGLEGFKPERDTVEPPPEPRPSDQEVAIQRAEQAPGGTGYVEVEPPPSRVNEDAKRLEETWIAGDRDEGSHEQQQEALDNSLSYHLGGGFLGGQPESTAGELRHSMSASTPEPERRPEPRAQKRYPRTKVLRKNPKLNQGGFY